MAQRSNAAVKAQMKRGNVAIPPGVVLCGARAGRKGLFGGLRWQRRDRDIGAPLGAGVESHGAMHLGEERVVAAHIDVVAGMVLGAALTHEDVAGDDELAAILLDAQASPGAVASVA